MRFYHIWHKNSIAWSLIEDPTGLFLASTPKVLKKNEQFICYMLYVVWSIRLFVEFVALSTNTWPKILIFTVTAKCWREGCYVPAPFTPRSDRCNLSCSFYTL